MKSIPGQIVLSLALLMAAEKTGAQSLMNVRGGSWRVQFQEVQPDAAVISGVVGDQSGAVIPGARLRLTNKTAGQARQVTADETGSFRFDSVPPGIYLLRIEAKNFVTAEREVSVRAGQSVSLKLSLSISAKAEEVTVSGSGRDEEESVSLERNADRLNFDDNLLRNLPAPGQNPLQIVAAFLSPAAQGGEGVSVSVEGVEAGGVDLPARSLRRLRVNRNPYSAEFRRPGRARIEALTDEGSFRRYHGSVGYYARNAVFDARNAFALTKPELDRRMFEMSLSGPLIGKRLAFFASGERLHNDESGVVNARLLSGTLNASVLTPERRTVLLGRLDWRASDKQTVVMLYNFRDRSERNRGVGGLKLPEQGISAAELLHRFQFSDRLILSPRWYNDLRLVVERESDRLGSPATGPALIVIGAFTGGQPQTFRRSQETTFRFQEIASYTRGSHALRFGLEARARKITATEASNFGGTFEFSSLTEFAAGTPFVFRVSQGNPEVSFTQHEVYGFIQDEIRLNPRFTLTPGLRYALQQHLPDRNNLAPRLAFAWSPGSQKTVIRGGAGIFYERLPEAVTQRRLLYDGVRLRELVITRPAYPDPFGSGQTLLPPGVVRVAGDLRAPYLMQAGISLERELWSRSQLAIEYQTLRGVRLLRSRNLNAPLPGSVEPGQRPDPALGNISQVESSALMRGQALSVTLRGGIGKRLKLVMQYTLAKTEDNTNGLFGLPANNYDLRPEWGRSDFDQRHRFTLAGTLELPAGFRLGSFVTLASGIPYDLTTGLDDNGDTVANDRPAGVTRNTGNGPGLARVDLRVTRAFRAPRLLDRKRDSSSRNLEFSVDFFNLFNRVNFENHTGAQSSPFFGRAVAAHQARTMQFSTRYRF
ncbi:MAG TPA: TonB-dependent receptor [Blastocatellia bacterium]|nr:TonB-dependent receptor [Blastocatellia bacterium]